MASGSRRQRNILRDQATMTLPRQKVIRLTRSPASLARTALTSLNVKRVRPRTARVWECYRLIAGLPSKTACKQDGCWAEVLNRAGERLEFSPPRERRNMPPAGMNDAGRKFSWATQRIHELEKELDACRNRIKVQQIAFKWSGPRRYRASLAQVSTTDASCGQ